MITAGRTSCQPVGGSRIVATGVLLGLAMALASPLLRADEPAVPIPSPAPPAWRQPLNAIQLAESAAANFPPANAADRAALDRQLDEAFLQLVARFPTEAAVRKVAGAHFWRVGNGPAAVAQWRVAQTLDPTDGGVASALGSAALHDGHIRDAREQFQCAVEAQPGVAQYRFDLANFLYLFRHELGGTRERPDETAVIREALAQYRRACELAADNVEYARGYAETFYGLPAPVWADALAAWEHVRALTANAPDFANIHLARVSLRMGRPDEAARYLERIHDPAFDALKENLGRRAAGMKAETPTVTQ